MGCSGNRSRARHKRGESLHNGDGSEVLDRGGVRDIADDGMCCAKSVFSGI